MDQGQRLVGADKATSVDSVSIEERLEEDLVHRSARVPMMGSLSRLPFKVATVHKHHVDVQPSRHVQINPVIQLK